MLTFSGLEARSWLPIGRIGLRFVAKPTHLG
jgi:hypothetical protein